MKKITIQDLSDACGLSTATIDRVLHDRPGVSAAARHKVLQKARELGYLPETDATPLPARPAHLEFILPVGTNEFLAELAAHLEEFCAGLPLVASCRVHRLARLEAGELIEAAERISTRTTGVGVVATEDPRSREVLKDLVQAGTKVVTIASDLPSVPRAAYVGVDNRSAGRLAGLLTGRLIRQPTAQVAVVLGTHRYRGHEERDTGFRSILAEEFARLTIVRTLESHDEAGESYTLGRDLLDEFPHLAGIYCIGGGRQGIVRALREAGRQSRLVLICHDHTAETRDFLLDGSIDAVIDQSARLVAEQSVIALLGSIASSLPNLTRKFIEPRVIFRENIPVAGAPPV